MVEFQLEFAAAFFYFHKKGIVQEMIHKLKYKGHEEIGRQLDIGMLKNSKIASKLVK